MRCILSGIWHSRPAHEHALGRGRFAFEVWTQAGVLWQAPVATRAHGRPASLEHIAVANGRTKEHTAQEARCNPPMGAGVCGNVPCWLALAIRRPPQAPKKSNADCFPQKNALQHRKRTRDLEDIRVLPGPLSYGGVLSPCALMYLNKVRRIPSRSGLNLLEKAALPPPEA